MRGRGIALMAGASIAKRRTEEESQAQLAQQQQAHEAEIARMKAQQAHEAELAQARQQAQGGQPMPPPAAPAPAGGTDITGELQKLAQLRQSGILTDEEFAAAKQKLLSR